MEHGKRNYSSWIKLTKKNAKSNINISIIIRWLPCLGNGFSVVTRDAFIMSTRDFKMHVHLTAVTTYCYVQKILMKTMMEWTHTENEMKERRLQESQIENIYVTPVTQTYRHTALYLAIDTYSLHTRGLRNMGQMSMAISLVHVC